MSSNFGIGQEKGTCWFYSSLNSLLLSENGQKILWAKLQSTYSKFTPKQKEYFDSNINAPCPRGIRSAPSIYFWKFLDQFLCSQKQGILKLYPGKEARLLKNVKFRFSDVNKRAARRGDTGAYAQKEIGPILNHLGFSEEYEILTEYKFNQSKKLSILVYDKKQFTILKPNYFPKHYDNFSLSGAILYVKNMNKLDKLHGAHDLACVVRGKKGYIIDSNSPYKLWECNWWDPNQLQIFLDTSKLFDKYNHFKNGQITSSGFEFIVYTNDTFTKDISPYCKRVKPQQGALKPAYKEAQIIRMVENIVNKATSRLNATNKFNALKSAGYFDESNRNTFINILNKKQFPSPKPINLPNKKIPNNLNSQTKNKKGRIIHIGERGGLYVIGKNGKKIYKSLVPSSGVNNKGRSVQKGTRGGHYVIHKGKKVYKFFH